MKIGLIGLGIMGKPMAKNLLKAGYELVVNDRNQASIDEVVAAGASYATQAEIGESCDVVLTMLPCLLYTSKKYGFWRGCKRERNTGTERILKFLQDKWNAKRNLGRMVQGAGAGLVIFVDC